MILITKTLVIFPLFYTPARRLRPPNPHTFVWWQCHRILASERTVKYLLSSDVDCSRFSLCSVVASICGKILFGLRNADSRETQSNGYVTEYACVVESEPWFTCWHGHVNTLNRVTTVVCTAMDVHCRYVVCYNYNAVSYTHLTLPTKRIV